MWDLNSWAFVYSYGDIKQIAKVPIGSESLKFQVVLLLYFPVVEKVLGGTIFLNCRRSKEGIYMELKMHAIFYELSK